MKKIFALLMMSAILFTACDMQIYEPNPRRESEEAMKDSQETSQTLSTSLKILDQTSTSFFIMDDKGDVFETSKIGYTAIHEGMIVSDCTLTIDHGELLNVSYGKDMADIGLAFKVKGSQTEGINGSANRLISYFVGNSDPNVAIGNYTINSIDEEAGMSDNIIKVTMNYSVEPSMFSRVWGSADEEGLVKDLSFTYDLYRANGKWVSLGDIGLYTDIQSSEETRFTASEDQKVLFENEDYSIYQEYQYEEADAKTPKEEIGFNTNISRVPAAGGDWVRMYSGDHNFNFIPVFKQGKDLYMETRSKEPYKDEVHQYFGILDLDRKYMTEAIEGPAFYGTCNGDIIYVFTDVSLYALDASTNKARVIAKSPKNYFDSVTVSDLTENGFKVDFQDNNSHEYYMFSFEDNSFSKVVE